MARKLFKISTLLLAIILVFTGCEFLQENLSAELLDAQNASIGDASVAVSTINYLGANDTTGTIVAEFTQGVDFAKDADGNDKALAGTAEFTYTAASLETDDDGARTGELTLPTTLDGKKLPFAIDTALVAMANATIDGISVSLTDIAGFVSTETEVKDRKLPAFSASFNIVPLFDETEAICSDLTQTVKSFKLNSDPAEALLATTGLTLSGAESYAFSEDEGVHYIDITLASADLVDGATLDITLSGLKDKSRADMTAVGIDFSVVVDLAANEYASCSLRGTLPGSGWDGASDRDMANLTYGLWATTIIVDTAGDYSFKVFLDNGDSTPDNDWYGVGNITNRDSTIGAITGTDNFSASFEVGTYFILVNERDTAATTTDNLSFTITKAGTNVAGSTFSTAVIKGGMNGWSDTDPWVMTYLGAETWLYYSNYTAAETQTFKFDDTAAWDGDDFGSAATGLPDDGGNISIEFTVDEYIFSFNEDKPLRSVVETL